MTVWGRLHYLSKTTAGLGLHVSKISALWMRACFQVPHLKLSLHVVKLLSVPPWHKTILHIKKYVYKLASNEDFSHQGLHTLSLRISFYSLFIPDKNERNQRRGEQWEKTLALSALPRDAPLKVGIHSYSPLPLNVTPLGYVSRVCRLFRMYPQKLVQMSRGLIEADRKYSIS